MKLDVGVMPPTPPGSQSKAAHRPKKIFDWISHPDETELTPFQRVTRNVDWTKSPLGPMDQWPVQLRQMVLLVIADPIPAVVFWGDNNTCIYNEAYTELIGSKHPAMQGGDPAVELAEVWDYYDSMLATQRETFLTVQDKNIQLFLKRRGFLEETYFTYKFVPIIGAEGYVVGSHVSVVETTHEVISSRRLATVNALKEGISSAKDIHALWCKIIKGLEHAQYDIPLVMLYSIAGVSDASITSSAAAISNVHTGSIECTLEGSIGIPEGHPVAPKTFALDQNKTWLADACRIGLRGAACVLLQVEDGSLPSDVVQGITWRGFGEPSTKFVVCPIHSTYSEEAVAFLVIALNPKRPFDEEYQDFLKTLTMQITTPQVSSVLLGAEVWKRQALARQESEDRAEISQESLMPAMEFDKFETRFARFAERAQVGLVISDAYGQILYANGLWREMAQLETGEGKEAWARGILAADLDFVYRMFDQIVRDGAPASFQFHLKTPWRSAGFNKDGKHAYAPTCVLCSSYPDKDENGIVTTVMSVLTNISELKWIEAQLRTRTAEVEQRELMWRNFTDRAPIGLCLIKAKGLLEFGNETWWSMTATPKGETSGLAWIEKEVIPKHVPKVKQMFEDALEKDYKQATPATMEFCLNRFWEGSERQHQPSETAKNGETRRTTILCTVHTTYNVDYTVRHVVGWLTDITAQKAAEAVLQKRMDQAIEMKKQQERFIDMTSHEMRNPLSAMLHCADEIIALLNKHRRDTPMKADSSHAEHGKNGCNGKHPLDDESAAATLLDDAIEAAETIIYCALHQKRIVDDILTLSRLDSNLLVISPEPGQPVQLVRSATKMFEAELRRADMTLEIQEEPTIQQLNVEWTLLDPSRVLQIFINLMTNAIKFTRAEETRHITVSIGASLRKPSEVEDIVEYIPQSQTAPDHTLAAEWGDGEILYLAMSVTDTGRGLSDQERKVLFHLFQQASPKTHVRYGGSGLGLFICRQLVEMQGGQIGVASEAGKGSTFRFFVKTRRTDPPPLQPSDSPMQEMVRHTSLGEACGLGPWTPQNDHYMPKAKRQRLNSSNGTNSPKPLGLHVLVVEDNLVNQKVASKQLRNCGYSVHVANHGEEALEFLKRTEYWNSTSGGEKLSVVLMDLEMPIMDGITCVKKIRELQAEGVIRGHVPVIAVTANARKDQIMDALSAGMDDVTTKPYRIQEMVKKIETLIARCENNGFSEVKYGEVMQADEAMQEE